MHALQVSRSGDRVEIEIEANAFLHHMVRNIVGSLLPVGRGEQTVGWIGELLAGLMFFGIIGITQVLAQELGGHGIAVNAICPGSVDTSRRESTSRRERALVERDPNAPVLSLPPTGRVARPDDIARLALFFASEASDHITGQAWNVDGGTVMH